MKHTKVASDDPGDLPAQKSLSFGRHRHPALPNVQKDDFGPSPATSSRVQPGPATPNQIKTIPHSKRKPKI